LSLPLLAGLSFPCHSAWNDFVEFFKEETPTALDKSTLNRADIVSGLKEALIKGSQSAISTLGKENGFFAHPKLRIPMPEKLQTVEATLRKLKQDKIADDFVLSMNRAAENAVPKAMSIFSNAIKNMSIKDANGILQGSDNAATEYLKKTSGSQLHQQFLPIVKQATNKVGVTENYKALIDNLGMMSKLIDIESLDLDKYVTDKAVDGLFNLIANEEKLIRADPVARTTALLKKVFSSN
tara:strand:- start:1937 stop:2653 length:717 start_codon:yes stop_codon:yes gene_type:complete